MIAIANGKRQKIRPAIVIAISVIPRSVVLEPTSLECVLTGAEGLAKIVDGEVISGSILSHMRVDGDTRILFLTNMGGKPYAGTANVQDAASVQLANPADGSVQEIECVREGALCRIPVRLKPYEGAGYIIRK